MQLAPVRDHLVSQFQRPRGALGCLAGWILARRPSNRLRNLWTVEQLALEPTHRVLELGFGPGLAIEACAQRATAGQVVGVDHSTTMLRAARRRNRRAIREGRVVLHAGRFERLDELGLGAPFDRILAVNALMFADEPEAQLRSLGARLRPGGRIAITFQSRRAGATSEDSKRGGEQLCDALRRAGLQHVRMEELPLKPVAAVCVLGERAYRTADAGSGYEPASTSTASASRPMPISMSRCDSEA